MRRLVTLAIAGLLVVATVPAAQAKAGKEDWRESGTVVRVLDGDTFDMDTAQGRVRVRVNGIQAPESTWCGGEEARNALEELLPEGRQVRLASVKERSGNAPRGVWRLKRTVYTSATANGSTLRRVCWPGERCSRSRSSARMPTTTSTWRSGSRLTRNRRACTTPHGADRA